VDHLGGRDVGERKRPDEVREGSGDSSDWGDDTDPRTNAKTGCFAQPLVCATAFTEHWQCSVKGRIDHLIDVRSTLTYRLVIYTILRERQMSFVVFVSVYLTYAVFAVIGVIMFRRAGRMQDTKTQQRLVIAFCVTAYLSCVLGFVTGNLTNRISSVVIALVFSGVIGLILKQRQF